MAFDAVTKSEHSARHVYLYTVEMPDGLIYRWADSKRSVTATLDGDTLTFKRPRGGIRHTEPTESAAADRTGTEIRVSPHNPVWRKHREAPPPGDVNVTIYLQVEAGGEAFQVWNGIVVETPKEQSEGKTFGVLKCSHLYELVQGSEGLTDTYGPTDSWLLGTLPCPVPLASVTDSAEVVSITPEDLEMVVTPSVARIDGWYKLGWIVLPDGDKRTINVDTLDGTDHVLTILHNFPVGKVSVGETVGLVWGDDHTYQTCRDKFGEWTGDGAAFGGNNLQGNVNFHQIGRLTI